VRERERDINSSPKKILRFVYMGRCAPREDAVKASDASKTRQKKRKKKKEKSRVNKAPREDAVKASFRRIRNKANKKKEKSRVNKVTQVETSFIFSALSFNKQVETSNSKKTSRNLSSFSHSLSINSQFFSL
jgi:hypothetical protein